MIKIKTSITIASLMFITSSIFAQWTTQTSNTSNDLKSISFPSNTTGFAVGLSGTILKTINSGTTWSTVIAPTVTQDLYTVKFIDDNVGFALGDAGKIFKTTDGGTTWTSKVSGTTNALLSVFIFNNGTTIFTAGASGTIKKSTDAGETWTNVNSGTTEDINAISFDEATNTTGYFVGNNAVTSYIYKSTDAGATWSAQTLPANNVNSFFGISTVDANNVFFCGGVSKILKTSNGGSTWTNVNSSTASFYRSCLFSSATNGYVVGGNGKIIMTANAGTSYTTETSGTTNILNCITKTPCGIYYVAGNAGTILKKGASVTGVTDNYSTSQTGPLAVTSGNGVLANDGQSNATVTVVTNVANGTLILNADGSFAYNPNSGYIGNDQFTYMITDNCGNTSNPITVNINSTASLNEQTLSNFSISQIHSENKIIIKSSSEEISSVKVYDMNAVLVKEISTNASEVEFSTEIFSKGLYNLTLITKNANNYSFKISKL